MLGRRFATDISRASLIKFNHLRIEKNHTLTASRATKPVYHAEPTATVGVMRSDFRRTHSALSFWRPLRSLSTRTALSRIGAGWRARSAAWRCDESDSARTRPDFRSFMERFGTNVPDFAFSTRQCSKPIGLRTTLLAAIAAISSSTDWRWSVGQAATRVWADARASPFKQCGYRISNPSPTTPSFGNVGDPSVVVGFSLNSFSVEFLRV